MQHAKYFKRGLMISMKRVNEAFSEYESRGNLNTAIIESVVLRKKTKILEMEISSDNYIELNEIESFNNFIKQRFSLNDSKIRVKYTDAANIKPIEEELENIICSLSNKYPALKSVVNNCEYEVIDKNINFNLRIPVSGFLKTMDYDKKINSVLKIMYGKQYDIKFIDTISGEEIAKMTEEKRANEMMYIKKEIKNTQSIASPPPEAPKKIEEVKTDSKAEGDVKKNTLLIMGRNANIKEPVIKINDITPDEGRIALEGEISNLEAKELRSGKMLISFDLYDGTNSMTCKAFCKPGEYDEVFSRIKKLRDLGLQEMQVIVIFLMKLNLLLTQ